MSIQLDEITTVVLNTEDAKEFQNAAVAGTSMPRFAVTPKIQNRADSVLQVRVLGVSIPYTFAHVRVSDNAWLDIRLTHVVTGQVVLYSWSPPVSGNYTIEQLITAINTWMQLQAEASSYSLHLVDLDSSTLPLPVLTLQCVGSYYSIQFLWSTGVNHARSIRRILGGDTSGDSPVYHAPTGVVNYRFPNHYNVYTIRAIHIVTDLAISPNSVSDASTRVYSPTIAVIPIYRPVGQPHTKIYASPWIPILDNVVEYFTLAVSDDTERVLSLHNVNWSILLQFRRVKRPAPEPPLKTLFALYPDESHPSLSANEVSSQYPDESSAEGHPSLMVDEGDDGL